MPRAEAPSSRILQVKVTLLDVRPPVWRRILVRDTTSLARFHGDLQILMGWTNSHMHQFLLPSKTERWGKAVEPPDEQRIRLGEVLTKPKARLIYEYDFGDSWEHRIELEGVVEPVPGGKYPWVVAGKWACPPEDVGGVPGYEHFLAVLTNPKHPEHKEMLDWAGGSFDPEAFDVAAMNRAFHGGWAKTR